MLTRRDFLQKAGIVAAATSFIPSEVLKAADIKTGLILYTVRNEMKNDPDGTLKAVSEMGYNWIEAANYSNGTIYDHKPADFRKKVESYGMKFVSSHCGVNDANIDKTIADSKEAGLKYIV